MSKAIVIVSGGLDSITLAYHLKALGYNLHLLSFNYNQRHKKELDFARMCAEDLKADIDVVDLSSVGVLLKGSSLTDNIPVPDGHYAAPNMSVTVVPNRNAIMLAVAYGAAVAESAERVCIGVHAGDHFIYPDCRPEFIYAFGEMERLANAGGPLLYAPFLEKSKADIVKIGANLGVPFEKTWSCYKGGSVHCGTCGTCVERKEAFELAGITDPTNYGA